MSQNSTDSGQTEKRSAGAFDIRTLIGALLGLYGVVLTVVGLFFADQAEKDRVNGANLNLEVGIGLIVFGVLFLTWVYLRPLSVPVDPTKPLD